MLKIVYIEQPKKKITRIGLIVNDLNNLYDILNLNLIIVNKKKIGVNRFTL